MRRDEVPEQDVVLDAELAQNSAHDRRARFRGTRARQLPLGGERDSGDARAAVTGGLTDEQHASVRVLAQVRGESLAQRLRVRVLVVRVADSRVRERVDEVARQATAPRIPARRFSSSSSRCRHIRFRCNCK